MRYLTFLLLVAAVAVALSLPADRATREVVACTYINAYSDDTTNVREGVYITITGSCGGTCIAQSCGGETLSSCYAVTVDSQCPPLAAGPATCVTGNNLSGHYLVALRTGNCLKLCACQ